MTNVLLLNSRSQLGGVIYGARGSNLYLMTGIRDVATCANIVHVYMENISELTFHRLASFLLNMISQVPVSGRALLENGIHYHDSDFTVVNSALQRGTNISISEN